MAMSEILRGSEFVVGPRIRVTENPSQGKSVEHVYEGTIETIRHLSTTLPAGSDYVLDETNPPKSVLVVRTQGLTQDDDTLLAAQFDIKANSQQKSMYEHPKSIALGTSILGTIRDELRKSSPDESNIPSTPLFARILFRKLRKGQDYFLVTQPVFRTTHIIKNRREFSFAISNLNCIYTTAQVIVEANPPLPFSGGTGALATLDSQMLSGFYENSIPSGFQLGWLKVNFELTTVPNNKSAATMEYVLDAWPTDTYPLSGV
jgi:hypothetical protein